MAADPYFKALAQAKTQAQAKAKAQAPAPAKSSQSSKSSQPSAAPVSTYDYNYQQQLLMEQMGGAPPATSPVPSPPPTPPAPPVPIAPSAPPTPTPPSAPSAPTTPDQPGGQVATVDGQKVYIAGSTMREKLGFETEAQYLKAQQRGQARGPLAGGQAAAKAVATEYGIPEGEAQRLIALAWETKGKAPELATLTDQQKQSLLVAGLGYDPWAIAPESIMGGELLPVPGELTQVSTGDGTFKWVRTASGKLVAYSPTRELQKAKYEAQQAAQGILKEANLLTFEGAIKPEAFTSTDPKVKQALYDVGVGGTQYTKSKAVTQALSGVPAEKIKTQGLGAKVAENIMNLAYLREQGVITPTEQGASISFTKGAELGYDWDKLHETLSVGGIGLAESERAKFEQIKTEQKAWQTLQRYSDKQGNTTVEGLADSLKSGVSVNKLKEWGIDKDFIQAAVQLNLEKEAEGSTFKTELSGYKYGISPDAASEILAPYEVPGTRTMKDEYPQGGAPFESYETAPRAYDIGKFMVKFKEEHPEGIEATRPSNLLFKPSANITAESVLLSTGYTKDQIQEAKDTTTLTDKPLSADAYVSRYFQERNWELPTYMGGTIHLGALAPQEEAGLWEKDGLYTRMAEASEAYQEKYGTRAVLESAGIKAISTLFPAGRAWYPEVKREDITPSEWTWTGFNIALFATPPVIKGIGALRAPKVPTLEYGMVSPKGVPITGVSEYGIPSQFAGRVSTEQVAAGMMRGGPTVRVPIHPEFLVKEGPASLAAVRASTPMRAITVYGESGVPTKIWTPVSRYQYLPGLQESMAGGSVVPSWAISGKGMNIPTSPPLSPVVLPRGISPVLPVIGAGTATRIATTATMTPEQVARLAPATKVPVFIWYEQTPGGLLVPKVSSVHPPMATPAVQVIAQEVQAPIEVPVIIPIETPAPTVVSPTVVPAVSPISTAVAITGEQIVPTAQVVPTTIPVQTPVTQPVPITSPIPYMPALEPTAVTPRLPEPDYEKPPVYKVPPPLPLKLPEVSLMFGRGIQKHGIASTYVKYSQIIPELVVYLPTWEGLKPPRLDSKLWRKFGTLRESVELLGEEEFEETPFGRKAVRPIVARAKLAAGAKAKGINYQPGITPAEEVYAPIVKKVSGKKQTAYDYLPQNDIGISKWVG